MAKLVLLSLCLVIAGIQAAVIRRHHNDYQRYDVLGERDDFGYGRHHGNINGRERLMMDLAEDGWLPSNRRYGARGHSAIGFNRHAHHRDAEGDELTRFRNYMSGSRGRHHTMGHSRVPRGSVAL